MSPSSDELEVIVTASGRGGLIDSVGVVDLEVVGGTGADEPWLRFDLTLNYCCAEPNSVVFPSDQWSTDVADAPLAVEGPMCQDTVECDDAERRLMLEPFEQAAVSFEVFRAGDDGAQLVPGTFVTQLQPVFHWVDDVIAPEVVDLTLRFDIALARLEPVGDTTPTATAHKQVTVTGGGLNLIGFPFAGVADDPAALAELVAGSSQPIEIDDVTVDWDSQVALVLSIGEDLCPAVLDHLDVVGNTATPVFAYPGYLGCEQPLVAYTVIAAVDRDAFTGVTELLLSADLAFSDDDTVVSTSVTPGSGQVTVVPLVAEFGEGSGTVPLPPRGEAAAGRLDDGTPVYVVHHHDGTVSALDPRGADQNVPGLFQVVRWVAATRNFLGRGAWDEYGRRLDGFRTSDLHGYATRVFEGSVEIGSPVPAPSGSPITATTDPPAMTDRAVVVDQPLDMTAALDLAPGTTAWIDGVVYATADGATVCAEPWSVTDTTTPPVTTGPTPIGCPDGSPVAAGIAGTPGYYTYFHGPLLASRTEGGFERIASSGGYGGSTL